MIERMATKTKIRYKSNRPVVIKAGQDAAERIGMRAGAFIMGVARRSIKSRGKKNKPSDPGQPPKSVTGALKANILFAWDGSTRTVVIGPRLLPGKTKGLPKALETGDTVDAKVIEKGKRVKKRINIESRPFMKPALNVALKENLVPTLWRGAIRR